MAGVINRPDVLHFLAGHHWVATVDQLRGLGVSDQVLSRARRRGEVVNVVRGLVTVPGIELTFEGRALAGQLAAGYEAFVSGPTAAALLGLRSMPRRVVEVTVREDRRVTLPAWARLAHTSWIDDAEDFTVRPDGLRVAQPLRMLFGLAAQFNQHRFERAAEDAWHLGLVSPAQAADYLASIRRQGRTGVARFEAWLEKTGERARPSQSGLELDFVDLLAAVGLPTPERQHPLVLASGETIHLDLAWPAARLAIEPGHTWWHGGDAGMRRDAARHRGCDEVGWRVIPYDESAMEDPAGTARQVFTIYRDRVATIAGRRSAP